MKNNQKGFTAVEGLLILAIVGLIGFAGWFVWQRGNNSKTVTSTKQVTGTAGNSSVQVSISTPVTKTENCGNQGCFDQKFASCSKATLGVDVGDLGAVHYEIYGPKGNGCSMLLRYTKNLNPDWVNKDLVCNWDNKMNLQDSVTAMFNKIFAKEQTDCTGPLLAILQAQ